MAIRNRDTLKKKFSEGQRPTEEDFSNLIDSTVNILDDGFSKNSSMGIKLAPLSEKEGTVMTFLQDGNNELIRWEIAVIDHKDLRISMVNGEKHQPLLLLKDNGDIELGSETTHVELTGNVRMKSRSGELAKAVDANGKWQDITGFMEGVCAFEVVVACGKRHTGKHAVLVATATHCFGSRPKIRKVSSHYGSFMNRVKLRWVKNDTACKLQVRTVSNFGSGVKIHCHLARLWDDPLMEKH